MDRTSVTPAPLYQGNMVRVGIVLPLPNLSSVPPLVRGDRYDALRICIGQDMIQKLADLKLFMVSKNSMILMYI